MDIKSKRIVQGTDITSERNVQGTDITSKRNANYNTNYNLAILYQYLQS